ncbi:hypothetical protein KP509_30G032700 [Ceratopteris richardii]|uniref:Uncharacterized protein n=1 Tax=Ceratopteris richardii TaxID=49495 RepID=A0A8T2R2D2_CERRI|nr:hypothetical protein KP509_30G032700 [Ceratopteris richardii]
MKFMGKLLLTTTNNIYIYLFRICTELGMYLFVLECSCLCLGCVYKLVLSFLVLAAGQNVLTLCIQQMHINNWIACEFFYLLISGHMVRCLRFIWMLCCI